MGREPGLRHLRAVIPLLLHLLCWYLLCEIPWRRLKHSCVLQNCGCCTALHCAALRCTAERASPLMGTWKAT
jgi:hypothetical protein